MYSVSLALSLFKVSLLRLMYSMLAQEYETTSGMGVKTAAGYTWNREQIFLPVKVGGEKKITLGWRLDSKKAYSTLAATFPNDNSTRKCCFSANGRF